MHLRNAATDLMRRAGYGRGYRSAHEDPQALDTLAAAYAAAGKFKQARATAASALEFARATDTPAMRSLAKRIEFRLRLYEGNRAFYEK